MSQVQPPRARPSNARPATIQILRWIILNGGALAVTTLLIRIAILIAIPGTTQTGLTALLRLTHVIVWPLLLLSPLKASLGGGFTVADLTALVIVLVFWIVALGVVAGWEREGQRMRSVTSDARLRP